MRQLLVVLVLGCGGASTPPPETPDTAVRSTPLSNTKAATGPTWKMHVGIDGCTLGASAADCEREFGAGTPSKEFPGEYLTWKAAGFQIALEKDGSVATVFVNYAAEGFTPFGGSDPSGIGAGAKPDAVLRAYGPASLVLDNVQSASDKHPGAREHTLIYRPQGLRFEFVDDALVMVMVGSPFPDP